VSPGAKSRVSLPARDSISLSTQSPGSQMGEQPGCWGWGGGWGAWGPWRVAGAAGNKEGDLRPGTHPCAHPAPGRPPVQLWLLPAAWLPHLAGRALTSCRPGCLEGGKNNPPLPLWRAQTPESPGPEWGRGSPRPSCLSVPTPQTRAGMAPSARCARGRESAWH
jgi:hypothetical protein